MRDADLASLYERYGPLVRRRCFTILKSPADADDALQEVFMRVQRYGVRPETESMLAWLYTLATNCCYDAMKKARRLTPLADNAVLGARNEALPASGNPNDGDRRALLRAVLSRLDRRCCEIGILHFLDGLTQDEVAQRTGYSRKTIGKKLAEFESQFVTMWRAAHGSGHAPHSGGAA